MQCFAMHDACKNMYRRLIKDYYPQKLVNHILVPIIIACPQGFTKNLKKERFSQQKTNNRVLKQTS